MRTEYSSRKKSYPTLIPSTAPLLPSSHVNQGGLRKFVYVFEEDSLLILLVEVGREPKEGEEGVDRIGESFLSSEGITGL